MFISCAAELESYFKELRGFKQFLIKEGRLIYHVSRIDKCDVPFFDVQLTSLHNMRICFGPKDSRLHVFMEHCYLTTVEPFDQVGLCIYDETEPSASDFDVLQGLYFVFRYRMLSLGGLALHAAAVEKDCRAIAFMGFSGAGKSTQAALWQKYQNAFALNLDKPAVFFENGKVIISGTPWSGKEYAYVNSEFPLDAIVFPVQAKNNLVKPMTTAQGVVELLQNNLIYPLSDDIYMQYVQHIEKLASCVTMARLNCTISEDAVRVLYEYLFKKNYSHCERELKVVKIKAGYILRNIADEWIVIPRGEHALKFSATIVLNETGAFLWNCLKEDKTIADLIDAMRSEYGIDLATAERDVKAFVEQLKAENVIELLDEERA